MRIQVMRFTIRQYQIGYYIVEFYKTLKTFKKILKTVNNSYVSHFCVRSMTIRHFDFKALHTVIITLTAES